MNNWKPFSLLLTASVLTVSLTACDKAEMAKEYAKDTLKETIDQACNEKLEGNLSDKCNEVSESVAAKVSEENIQALKEKGEEKLTEAREKLNAFLNKGADE